MNLLTVLALIVEIISNALSIADTADKLEKRQHLRLKLKSLLFGNQLVYNLRQKYPGTKFLITDDKNRFYQKVAQEFIKAIDQFLDYGQASSAFSDEKVSVGVICGPMILNTAEWISKKRIRLKHRYGSVQFVAMNKAAEMDNFNYSANYLATFFSKLFPESASIAHTGHPCDQEAIDKQRKAVDILLCSAGSVEFGEKSYMNKRMNRIPTAGINEVALEKSCVGDFCLTPIDADGRVAAGPELLARIKLELDPYPAFSYIKQIKQARSPYIIFAIKTGAIQSANKGKQGSQPFAITGKELVARAVLRSGVADVCVLDSKLAKNLSSAVGGFLIHHLSPRSEADSPYRKARAYDLFKKEEREIAILDPKNRLDALKCELDETLHPPLKMTDTIPSIVFSEITNEDKNYHWEEGYGDFEYRINGKTYAFQVDKDVRRPGMWSIISTLQGVRYVGRDAGQGPYSIWDVGCGCGVMGILIEELCPKPINKILFSDIESHAITCAEKNIVRMELRQKATFKVADLFDAAEKDEKFDMIIFNPPFAPMEGITNLGAQIDAGGATGIVIATRFCEGVYQYLQPGGWAVIAVPDYIDDGRLQKILESRFGSQNLVIHNRFILYPYKTEGKVPTAFEIQNHAAIENNCHYSFETCYFGDQKYLSFRMRHYLAQRPL